MLEIRHNSYQHGSIFVQKIKENDGLTERSPEDSSGRESDHISCAAPEGHVVLEGQEVEQEVNGRHGEGHQQEDQARVHEDALDLVSVFQSEPQTLRVGNELQLQVLGQ